MQARTTLMTTAAFASALVLSVVAGFGVAGMVESSSRSAVKLRLEAMGHGWAQVETDGLQVIVSGTAPSEAARFRAVTAAGSVVQPSRIVDVIDVVSAEALAPPTFSLEILRNDDGIQLIGLLPVATDREKMIEDLKKIAEGGTVTDMLESANYPAPAGWASALDFAMHSLRTLPRSKISVSPGAVEVEAITDSPEDKARAETSLARRRPADLKLSFDISAPAPVITPFTLRFLIDAEGARFDACSANTARARDRIIAAARDAGAEGAVGCTIGMGVPSPAWADAVTMALGAMKELGAGSVTFSDADIALVAANSVSQASFDKVVGELESNLPDVFSLKAELEKTEQATPADLAFAAQKSADGNVVLRGRVTDERQRDVIENFARARFGHGAVYGATRTDETLPAGWSVRSLAALEALGELHDGKVLVTPDLIRIDGVSGNAQVTDAVSRIISARLGESAAMELHIAYDKRLDPVLGLPDGPECVDRLNTVLTAQKISFEPGSSVIAAEGAGALDALAAAMKNCTDFRMEVAGHTDSQGREETNLALSQERAQAVVRALMERRVLTGNLTPKGYGESQPIGDNTTEEGREENRRIEFVLLDAAPVEDAPLPMAEPPREAGAPPETAEETPAEEAPGEESQAEDPLAEPHPDADAPMDGEHLPDTDGAQTEEPMDGAVTDPADETAEDAAPEAPAEDAAPEAAESEAAETVEEATEAPADLPPEVAAAQDPNIEITVETPDDATIRPDPRPEGLGANQ